jgi:hypothetical protein
MKVDRRLVMAGVIIMAVSIWVIGMVCGIVLWS